ncbi:Tricorn protease C1 domain-containing protein [Flexibacter flexilis DSM 6793]|uniref:Tricorn protease C1 domain-containing protein n=1 Tax=Flexibacter flexilis DSM 6793 TaxID=927664 RepID=A0A1I1N3Y8_9BACT|nr:S41 family peptidase [Flexibacter flexilis]SFC92145.1 Tricorn protease C1 domain-containing protein [Flexibacter flexilis DSM 6793]
MQKNIILVFLLFLFATNHNYAQKLSQPEKDFELFWTTFRDNYAFFALKNVNWDSTYAKYRPMVSSKTKEKELISILGQMVAPLKDGHITISKGEEMVYKSPKTSHFKQEFKGMEAAFWQTVDTTLLQNGFSKSVGIGAAFKGEKLYYFAQSPQVAYIRITRCFNEVESLFDDKKEGQDTRQMLHLFDSLLTKISDIQTLIVDLRGNGGGHGGLELASRLATEKRLTHYKAIRQKGGYQQYSTPEPQYIAPNNGVQYHGKVILLTSDKTASSAEDFTISLCQQPNVTTVGTNTSGMLSDMYGANLSHDIAFTLSNQVYYSAGKEILEDKGVSVTHRVANTKQDIQRHQDTVLQKAFEVLYSTK